MLCWSLNGFKYFFHFILLAEVVLWFCTLSSLKSSSDLPDLASITISAVLLLRNLNVSLKRYQLVFLVVWLYDLIISEFVLRLHTSCFFTPSKIFRRMFVLHIPTYLKKIGKT